MMLAHDGGFSIRLLTSMTCPGETTNRREAYVPMKIAVWLLGACLAMTALPTAAADAGIVTIVEGAARVLRGTVWYKLLPGAVFQDGDIIDAGERTQVQVELTTGGALNLVGPGSLYAAAIPVRGEKLEGAMEFALDRGWLKVVATAPSGTRLRVPTAMLSFNEATIVARQESRILEVFVESGSARIVETNRTGRDGIAHDAKAGEYWSRDGDKPMVSERRAPVKFVASMPRHLIERLASLTAKFKGKKTPLAVDREITLAEADPWLTGPYRRTFTRRLAGRLADPAFRKAVEANAAAYPEWDRVLHPEKYPAGVAAPGSPPVAPPPVAGVPPSTTKAAPPVTGAAPPKGAPAAPATPPATVPKRSGLNQRLAGTLLGANRTST
jgi:hypothetical protein